MSYLLDNVQLAGDENLGCLFLDGSLQKKVPLDQSINSDEYWDLEGRLVLPAFVELHTHLDKTYAQIDNSSGGLAGAIEAYREYKSRRSLTDVENAATRALFKAVSAGVTCLRSHVNAAGPEDVELINLLDEVRKRFAPMIDIQLVAMGSFGVVGESYIATCIEAGADMVGGAPALQEEPYAAVARAVSLAAELEVPLDLHIDEHLKAEVCTLATLCDEIEKQSYEYCVTASHCASLSLFSDDQLFRVTDAVHRLGINIVALPVCNMVLLGGDTRPYVRGTAPVSKLMGAGANVCIGSDNVRDPFNPFGGYDPLRSLQISNILEFRNSTEAIKSSLNLITDNARKAFDNDVVPGGDVVVLESFDLLDALCDPPFCLATFKEGRRVFMREVKETWVSEHTIK